MRRSLNDNKEPDWVVRAALNPQWDKANRDWRVLVGPRTRELWHTLKPEQQRAIVLDADAMVRLNASNAS